MTKHLIYRATFPSRLMLSIASVNMRPEMLEDYRPRPCLFASRFPFALTFKCCFVFIATPRNAPHCPQSTYERSAYTNTLTSCWHCCSCVCVNKFVCVCVCVCVAAVVVCQEANTLRPLGDAFCIPRRGYHSVGQTEIKHKYCEWKKGITKEKGKVW